MKRITLAIVALTAGSVVGVAQEPPTPPARPVPAPAPTPRPSEPAPVAPAPRARPAAPVPFRDFDYEIDRDRVREVERQAQEMAREASRIDQEQVREITRRANEMAREAVRIDQRADPRDSARRRRALRADGARHRARLRARFGSMQPRRTAPMPPCAPMPSNGADAADGDAVRQLRRTRLHRSSGAGPVDSGRPGRLRLSPRPRGPEQRRLRPRVAPLRRSRAEVQRQVPAGRMRRCTTKRSRATRSARPTSSIRPRRSSSRCVAKLPVRASTSSNDEGGFTAVRAGSAKAATDSVAQRWSTRAATATPRWRALQSGERCARPAR